METLKTQYGVHQAAVHPNHSTLTMQRRRTQDCLHVKNTERILVKSPNTDIYHIGLPLHHHQQKTIIIQMNKYNGNDLQYFYLQALVAALENDPDLSVLPKQLPQIP